MSLLTQYVFGKRIGNRQRFALEFEGHKLPDGSVPTLWNEWYGYLWLWAEGHLVGNPFECEMISIGLESLQEVAGDTGRSSSSLLSGLSSAEALEMVLWARYGNDDYPLRRKLTVDRESLKPFEVLPRRTGPFFDGWQAILLEEGGKERLIYRQQGKPVAETVWPLETFCDVIMEGRNEFEKHARALLKRSNVP